VSSHADLLERIRAVPGVEAASLASDLPFGGSSAVFYSAEGDATVAAETMPRAYIHRVTPEFFATLRIRLEAGPYVSAGRRAAGQPAVVVSHNVTRRFWPNQDPIGKRIKFGAPGSQNPWLTIVGVVDEVKYRGLPENPTRDPDLYLPYIDRATQGVVVRTRVEPASLATAVRAAIRAGTHRSRPSTRPRWRIWLRSSRRRPVLRAGCSVSLRRPRWCCRWSASTESCHISWRNGRASSVFVWRSVRAVWRIVRRVLRDGMWRVAIGAAIGLAATTGLARVLAGLVYGVGTFDISSLLAVATLVVVAIAAAGSRPCARRGSIRRLR
jgi:putative ABC transport system permease protein